MDAGYSLLIISYTILILIRRMQIFSIKESHWC
jgi:hypothetical protein